MVDKNKVWLITGSSTGFGRELAEQSLERGYKVIATARNPEAVKDLTHKYPETARSFQLDVTNPEDVKNSVAKAIKDFGAIDILANNAGYGLGGGIEEPSEEQIYRQYETNLFGVIRMMRAVLPLMRKRKSGHILNISSVVGVRALPSAGYYSSTKFAIEALSEALAQEIEHLGVKVTLVEPGGFRTDFAGRSFVQPANRIEDYITSERIDTISDWNGKQMGDPKKGARAIIDMVEMTTPPLRFPLGEDAITAIEEKLGAVQENINKWRSVALSTKAVENQHEA